MRKLFVLILALASCGFAVLTPESRRKLSRERRNWHSCVSRRFDSTALHSFLVGEMLKVQQFNGVDLKHIRIGSTFAPDKERFCLVDSEWIFVCPDPNRDDFELRSIGRFEGRIVFHCVRKEKRIFQLTEISSDDVIWLCPPPYVFGPNP